MVFEIKTIGPWPGRGEGAGGRRFLSLSIVPSRILIRDEDMAQDSTHRALFCVLGASLVLNLWGIDGGLPETWHEDELTGRALRMASSLSVAPPFFYYGALHYFQIIAVTVPTWVVTELLAVDQDTQRYCLHLAARALTAVFATGTVALTFLMARQLFGQVAAILAAFLLAISVGFVDLADRAREDMSMLFWMMASLYMSSRVLTKGDRWSYLFAGLFAGLATSVKYNGGFAIVGLLIAYLLRGRGRDHLGTLYGLLAATAAFLVTNPAVFLSSCAFIEGTVIENAFNAGLGLERTGNWIMLLASLDTALGGLMVVVALGAAYAVWLVWRRRHVTSLLLLGSTIAGYLALMSGTGRYPISYVVPVVPLLLMLVGKLVADLIASPRQAARWAGLGLIVISAISGLAHTIDAAFQETFDSRKLAQEWLERNLPPGSAIERTTRGVANLGDRYVVVTLPHDHAVSDRAATMRESVAYRRLMETVHAYQRLAEALGWCDGERPYYQAWFDRSGDRLEADLTEFDPTIEGLEARGPDALVVSSYYYDRFKVEHEGMDDPASDPGDAGDFDTSRPGGRFFARLFAGESSYRPVARFHTRLLSWTDSRNPTIWIFQSRTDQTS